MTKPPYLVPLMSEIEHFPKNGYKAISTFSGCGGSCLGHRMAGFDLLWANEFIPEAQVTYKLNHPTSILDPRDIRKILPEEILAAIGLQVGELDLMDGSPPCSSFSTAGIREEGWGRVKKYCVAPDTRILTSELKWKRADELIDGELLVGFDEDSYGRGGRLYRTTAVVSNNYIMRPSLHFTFDDGTEVISSIEHRWLAGSPKRGDKSEGAGRNQRWRRADSFRVGDNVLKLANLWGEDISKDCGWLAGIFDGEAHVSIHQLGVAQTDGLVKEQIKKLLTARGFQISNGNRFTTYIQGGLGERLRALGLLRPIRLLAKAAKQWEGIKSGGTTRRARIVKIDNVGTRKLIALSTTSKTFIAEGLLSHNSDTEQRTDDLFFEFARLLKGLQPKVFVAENVKGLTIGVAKEVLGSAQTNMFGDHKFTDEDGKETITKKDSETILHTLMDCGYVVGLEVLNAEDHGVPQSRNRVIFVGIRKDLAAKHGLSASWPRKLGYRYTVRDAIPWIGNRYSGGYRGEIEPETDISRFAIGEEWDKIKPGEQSERYFSLVKPDLDKPCPTITAAGGSGSIAGVVHPTEKRKFTIAELKRICGFPDDFQLTGTYQQKWERLGRAVPPVLMARISSHVKEQILDKIK